MQCYGGLCGRRVATGRIDAFELVEARFECLAVETQLGAKSLERGVHSGFPSAAMRSRSEGGASWRRTRSTGPPNTAIRSATAAK